MKRKDLTSAELNHVIELRQAGKNWTEIGEDIGIDRRIVQRGYKFWEKDQSKQELAAARINVVGEAIKDHINNIVKIAMYLNFKLVVLPSPSMTMVSKAFITDLWGADILGQIDLYRPLSINQLRENEFIHRSNELLFKSLLDHAQESTVSKSLQEWGKAWDNSLFLFQKFRDETTEMIRNFLSQDKINVEQVVDGTEKEDPISSIVEDILRSLWNKLLRDPEGAKESWVKLELRDRINDQYAVQTEIKLDDNVVLKLMNKNVAVQLIRILEMSIANICKLHKETILDPLHNNIIIMGKAIGNLDELLNPIRLRPMIIRSKCDMCPI